VNKRFIINNANRKPNPNILTLLTLLNPTITSLIVPVQVLSSS